jgi:hypothetical protein
LVLKGKQWVLFQDVESKPEVEEGEGVEKPRQGVWAISKSFIAHRLARAAEISRPKPRILLQVPEERGKLWAKAGGFSGTVAMKPRPALRARRLTPIAVRAGFNIAKAPTKPTLVAASRRGNLSLGIYLKNRRKLTMCSGKRRQVSFFQSLFHIRLGLR